MFTGGLRYGDAGEIIFDEFSEVFVHLVSSYVDPLTERRDTDPF